MREVSIRKWFGQAGASAYKKAALKLSEPIAYKIAAFALRIMLGICFSQAVVLDGSAPFGLGYAAAMAAAGVKSGLSGFLGVLVGYIMAPAGVDGLKYIAAAILIFSAGLIFRDLKVFRSRLFMPAVSGAAAACVGIVFVAQRDFAAAETVLYLSEVILAAGSAYFYRLALGTGTPDLRPDNPPRGFKRVVGRLIMVSTLILPLMRLNLPLEVSAGALFSAAITLAAAYFGGAGAGAAAGICLGLTADAALGQPGFSMMLGFGGLLAGVMSEGGRPLSAGTFVLAGGAASLLSWGLSPAPMITLIFAGASLMLMPEGYGDKLREFCSVGAREGSERPFRGGEQMGRRLEQVSRAFGELQETLTAAFQTMNRANDADIAMVYNRASGRVCRKCALAGVCWQRDAVSTYNALNDMTENMLRDGKVKESDFPPYFAVRCLSLAEFTKSVNQELGELMYRRQYKNRINESRDMVCSQYGELSRVLGGMAEEVSAELGFNPEAERRIERFFKKQGLKAAVSVFMDKNGKTRAEIEGQDLSPLTEPRGFARQSVSGLVGVRLGEPEQQRGSFGERLIFTEAAPLAATLGVAAHRKRGQSVSGDSWTYFRGDAGMLYVLLSDGMGSGDAAAADSSMALRLLERFLRAGVAPSAAIRTLSSALVLRSGDDCIPVTLDVLSMDLYTGDLTFYKCGAAPSYVRRGKKITRVVCQAMPAGVSLPGEAQMDISHFKIGGGDMVVIASDGVAGGEEDLWLYEMMEKSGKTEVKEFSALILEKAAEKYGRIDDMTVLTLSITRRKEGGPPV